MTDAEAHRFAGQWIESWNGRELERILAHYRDDVEVTSPLVERLLGPGLGTVRGKPALRACWSRALEQFPDLHLTLYGVYRGVDSLVVHYQSELGLLGTELFVFDDTGLVRFGVAHYAEGAAPAGAR